MATPLVSSIRLKPSLSRWRNLISLAIPAVILTACDQEEVLTAPVESREPPQHSISARPADVITSNPQELADAVRELGMDNELLVWVRDADENPRSALFLADEIEASLVVGLPKVAAGKRPRTTLRPAKAHDAAIDAVLSTLASFSIRPYKERHVLPVFAIRVPDKALVPVLAALLRHPNVDLIEANQRYVSTPLIHPRQSRFAVAGPQGNNPIDMKHTMHNVDDVWAYTRGQGVKVGVFDTGFVQDLSRSMWPPDGYNFSGRE